MSRSWSATDEFRYRRRLVRIHRTQQGHFIHVGCEVLSAETYARMSDAERDRLTVVSCLYRDDHDACYVTLPDILYLLEAFIGVRVEASERARLQADVEVNPVRGRRSGGPDPLC
jgi:hypothetical protein